ncbi:MAG: hypothetical protein ACYDHH_04165 [Solirubrobacteraceae bacterium]
MSAEAVDAGLEGLRALLAARIVTVAGEVFTGRDVVTAGVIAGLWKPMEQHHSIGVATLGAAEPPAAAVTEEIRAFRYRHRLISAQEFLHWLDQRDLDLEALKAAAARKLARLHARAGAVADEPADDATVLAALPAEAIYLGVLASSAQWLVDRVLAPATAPPRPVAEDMIAGVVAREQVLLVSRAARNQTAAADRARVERLLVADWNYRTARDELVSDVAVAAEISRHAVDWLRLELDELSAANAGVAAEIAALLREGMDAERVAELSGSAVRREVLYVEEAPEQIRGHLIAAAAGETIGPQMLDGALKVWNIRGRRMPTIGDGTVRERAAAMIVEERWAGLRAGQVQWHDRH